MPHDVAVLHLVKMSGKVYSLGKVCGTRGGVRVQCGVDRTKSPQVAQHVATSGRQSMEQLQMLEQ